MSGQYAGSRAPALVVINKWHEARHSGRDSCQAVLPGTLRVNANLLQTDLCRNLNHKDVMIFGRMIQLANFYHYGVRYGNFITS